MDVPLACALLKDQVSVRVLQSSVRRYLRKRVRFINKILQKFRQYADQGPVWVHVPRRWVTTSYLWRGEQKYELSEEPRDRGSAEPNASGCYQAVPDRGRIITSRLVSLLDIARARLPSGSHQYVPSCSSTRKWSGLHAIIPNRKPVRSSQQYSCSTSWEDA